MTTDTRPNGGKHADQLRALFALKPGIEPRSVLVWRVLTPADLELATTDHEAVARGFARYVTGLVEGSTVVIERPDGEIETFPPPSVTPLVPVHASTNDDPHESA